MDSQTGGGTNIADVAEEQKQQQHVVECGDDGNLVGFNNENNGGGGGGEGEQDLMNEALFSQQLASHVRNSSRSSSFKRENLPLPHRTSHKQKRMQTIREEDIINMPENQALTDSCGDDKSSDAGNHHHLIRKLDSESFPKFDSGVRPSTTQYTATFENHTDPGSILIPASD